MGNNIRGTSFPVIALDEAVSKLKIVYEKVGKGPSTKEEYLKGLGYSGLSGSSGRMFAAFVHYNLFTKTGTKYKFSDLALNIIFPKNGAEPDASHLVEAALYPKLFNQLFERYIDESLPTMLENTLIIDFQVNANSAKEAASNFRQTLDYAGLLERGIVSKATKQIKENDSEKEDDVEVFNQQDFIDQKPSVQNNIEDMNRIEIVLSTGVKAGIYAPHNISDTEKDKLKKIIDLL